MKQFLAAILLAATFPVSAQVYNSGSIFAHNDYVHAVPFYTSYSKEVGYIEADIFLDSGELFVAHTREEIEKGKTLDVLYLTPIEQEISKHDGLIYSDSMKTLTLMIDLKTEGIATLHALVEKLKKYPRLLSCRTLQFTVSGNMPDPSVWHEFPQFIHFDGRPGINYTLEQLARVSLISTSFKAYASWNGEGTLTRADHEKISTLINDAHAKGKKIRFWATPDFTDAWAVLIRINVDLINTDDVEGLSAYLDSISKK